jgi:hypothetical protein
MFSASPYSSKRVAPGGVHPAARADAVWLQRPEATAVMRSSIRASSIPHIQNYNGWAIFADACDMVLPE